MSELSPLHHRHAQRRAAFDLEEGGDVAQVSCRRQLAREFGELAEFEPLDRRAASLAGVGDRSRDRKRTAQA